MSSMSSHLEEVWNALRASQPHRDDVLSEVRIQMLRGISDLRVPLAYPVSVLAGPNGCGKSTVLLACACAYRDPGRKPGDLTPTRLFLDFTHGQPGEPSDQAHPAEFEFHYVHERRRHSMVWRRQSSWNRSYMGRKGAQQPQRPVFLRKLANLANPSEVRGIQKLGRKGFRAETLGLELLIFAHRILPWRYRDVAVISGPSARDLLFAKLGANVSYSEFHMSSGERSVLRLSKDVSELSNALVLIDDLDTGLHPYTQVHTMLELQRTALRRKLQIVVATHSPVVIDSVPPEARIVLDRDVQGKVTRVPAYRDIVQRALYGQSHDQLSILCEDAVAEGLIGGCGIATVSRTVRLCG